MGPPLYSGKIHYRIYALYTGWKKIIEKKIIVLGPILVTIPIINKQQNKREYFLIEVNIEILSYLVRLTKNS